MNTTTPAETPKDIIAEMKAATDREGIESVCLLITKGSGGPFWNVFTRTGNASGTTLEKAIDASKLIEGTRIKNLRAEAALIGMTLVKEESK